jgi:hypothetical protein
MFSKDSNTEYFWAAGEGASCKQVREAFELQVFRLSCRAPSNAITSLS